MKRSEALERIAKILYNQALRLDSGNFFGEFNDFRKEWIDDADEILSELEKLGMEPPPHQERVGTGYPDGFGGELTTDDWVQGWDAE